MKPVRLLLIFVLCVPSWTATKLRLHNTAAAIAGYKAMDISLGPSGATVVTSVTTATVSGTDIQATATAGGSTLAWISEPLSAGFTLSGTVTGNPYGKESATSVNASLRWRLYKYSGGSEGSAIATCQATAELTASITVKGCTATPTSTAFSTGDRIVAKLFLENCSATSGCPTGTMAAGTVTVDYDGGTDAVDGSTWIQINENATFTPESAGHMILISMSSNPGTGWSVSDDGGNVYNQGPTCTNGFEVEQMFYALNVSAARKITVTHSGDTVNFFSASAKEFSNIPIASALDVSTTNCAAGGTSVTAGSFTPNVSGDVLIQSMHTATSVETTAYSTATQGSCAWSFADTRITVGRASQWCNYASTSAINPTLTRTDSGFDFYSVAAAFKQSGGTPALVRSSATPDMSNTGQTSAAGANMVLFLPDPALTAATGMYMAKTQQEVYQFGRASTLDYQFAHTGNLVVLVYYGGSDEITGVSSTPSHTWTAARANVQSSSDHTNGSIWCSDTGNSGIETLSISATSSPTTLVSDPNVVLFDVVGAKATACADAVSGFAIGDKTGVTPLDVSSGGVTSGSLSITPASNTSLIVAAVPVDFNTINAVTNGQLQNCYLSTNSSANTPYCENNGIATVQNHATSAFEFVWALQSGLGANTGEYVMVWAEFPAPAAGGANRRRASVIGQ